MLNANEACFLQLVIPGNLSPVTTVKLEGLESLSQPFEFKLSVFFENPNAPDKLQLGQSLSVAIHHPNPHQSQWFNGVLGAVEFGYIDHEKQSPCVLTLVPKIFLMKERSHSRGFENKSVIDIIKFLLQTHKITHVDYSKLDDEYPIMPYCVQYEESDFDFFARLLQAHGIYYYFRQSQVAHTLVLSDRPIPSLSCSDILIHCHEKGGDGGTVFHWQESLSSTASSNYPNLCAGMQVKVDSMEDPQVTGEYYLSQVHHFASAAQTPEAYHSYHNQLKLLPQSMKFEPLFKHYPPQMPGLIPAMVTGPKGAKIYSNAQGEIKVNPKWGDKYQEDKANTCWVRVTQDFAGNGWGGQFLPRVGQQVMLYFQQGHYHKPTVIGAYFNDAQIPYFDTKSQSGFRSQSLGDDKNQGHELRFDDTPNKEEFYLRSSKDKVLQVKGDRYCLVKKDSKIVIQQGDYVMNVGDTFTLDAKTQLRLAVGSSEIILNAAGVHIRSDVIDFS